jgi:tetratricopeptide (TPR) repeat protein
MPLWAQEKEADEAWDQGRHEAARAGYERVLQQNPHAARANLRLGILLSWAGKLDSALVLIARARSTDPDDADIALAQARVLSWKKRYDTALALYDSLLTEIPDLRDAALGRAQTLSWAGRLKEAESRYRAILAHNPRDADALAGLGYVYHWQGRESKAHEQARAALAVDSTHLAARALRRTIREVTQPKLEGTAAWSNDSDRNTSFWQTLGASAAIGGGVEVFGSVNALEASDPARDATRVGSEAGLSVSSGRVQLSGAAGVRRIVPEVAAPRTEATYRGRLGYRPTATLRLSLGYSRLPFDEIAALMERVLNLELLEAGLDARPFHGFSIYATGGELWLNDGNSRTELAAGLSQKLDDHFTVGLFGRTLSYERRDLGYFSPDRFSVLEATTGYSVENQAWIGSLGGGLGAQQVGKRGATQSEWHIEGRLGRRWGEANRIELFGLVTNSAVSSTTGAFRYRSAGLTVRLGL